MIHTFGVQSLRVNATQGMSDIWVKVQENVFLEPRSEKTGLRGFRPGPTQTGLYSYERWLEA